MNTKFRDILIITVIFAGIFGLYLQANGALLSPNRPGGLLQNININNLVAILASPFKVGGTSTSTITGDGTESTLGGSLAITGGLRAQTASSTSSTTLTSSDFYFGSKASGTSITVTLPSATTSQGKILIIKDELGNAPTSTTVIATATSSQTIDGQATTSITSKYGVLRLISNGANWFTW